MNICILCYRGNPYCGGQGVYLDNLSRELANLGHRVTLLVGPPLPLHMEWAEVIPLENHRFWGRRRDFLPPGDPFRILTPLNFFEYASSRLGYFPEILAFSLRAFKTLGKILKVRQFDIVHDVETLGYGTWFLKSYGPPVVCTVHHPLTRDRDSYLEVATTLLERYYNLIFFPVLMQKFVINRTDRVITSSRIALNELVRTFGLRRDKISVVFSGIDTEFFRPDPSLARERDHLLFVGNAQDPRKGIRYLFDAMAMIPPEVRLTIVDRGAPDKPLAPELARESGIGRRVSFTGRISAETLRELYQRAWALVLPSLYEGFGLPAVEAMASGCPVIVTNCGALPEVVGQDGCAKIVPPRDSGSLAKAIEALRANPTLATEMGRRGRKRAEEKFSWRKTAMETTRVYEETIRLKIPAA